jgi:hypothetical protein
VAGDRRSSDGVALTRLVASPTAGNVITFELWDRSMIGAGGRARDQCPRRHATTTAATAPATCSFGKVETRFFVWWWFAPSAFGSNVCIDDITTE